MITRAPKDVSPRASGPAGGTFEAHVATHYALALLAQTEARGLPGVLIDRIEFQRSGQGHPLDDIIVKGPANGSGVRRVLEVQAKRSMAFSQGDGNFKDIMRGVVAGWKVDPDRRFAVAIERTSGPIENGVQETLELARNTTDYDSYNKLLNTPGRSNKLMVNFHAVFRKHLSDNGVAEDHEVHAILKAFFVLHFDYGRAGSSAEYHDRSRASALIATDMLGDPYDTLFHCILEADAIGGDVDRSQLVCWLHDRGISTSEAPRLVSARNHIEEMSRLALARIHTSVGGFTLLRDDRLRSLEDALFVAGTDRQTVEITGPSGVGKSALMKAVVERRSATARCLVRSPDRTPSGGWAVLRTTFGIDASPEVFLADLACDGGGLVCIDGLDRFSDEGQRNTVFDILKAALVTPGVTVLFTAQPGWESEAASWFGETMLTSLSDRQRIAVDGLDDAEADALAEAAPQLAALLRADHPAKSLARNPMKLSLLISTRLNTDGPLSEAELALAWWKSGANSGSEVGSKHARTRVLLAVAEGLTRSLGLVDVSQQDARAVETLITDGTLDQVRTDRVKFRHDLYADFAIGCCLAEAPECLDGIDLSAAPPFWISRAFELACRLLAESKDSRAWPQFLEKLEVAAAGPGWTGLALLALVRSEQAEKLLATHSATLLEGDGDRAAALMKRVLATHVQPVHELVGQTLPPGIVVPQGLTMPSGPQWVPLVVWCLAHFDSLPPTALSATVDLFASWLVLSKFGERAVSPILLERLADILVADIEEWDLPLPQRSEKLPKIRYAVSSDARETARMQLAVFAQCEPSAAARYLSAIAASKRPDIGMRRVLEFPGHFPSAAPSAFVAAFEAALHREDKDRSGESGWQRRHSSSSILDGPFTLGKSGPGLFKALLSADRKAGLRLVRGIVTWAEGSPKRASSFVFILAGAERQCKPTFSYGWSRDRAPSAMVGKALVALEAWAHERVEAGEVTEEIVAEISGVGPIGGAFLLVVVDLALSHARIDDDLMVDLAACPELLALDATRANYDKVGAMSGDLLGAQRRSRSTAEAEIERSLAQRSSRAAALHDVIPRIALSGSEKAQELLHTRFETSVNRLTAWTSETVAWDDPCFMASHALRLIHRENYNQVEYAGKDGAVRTGWAYQWPERQARWLEAQSAVLLAEQASFTRGLALRMAMDKEVTAITVSVADAEAMLAETVGAVPHEIGINPEPDDPWLSRLGASAFLARFASEQQLAAIAPQLKIIFDQALAHKSPTRDNLRYDVMYSPQALAISGLTYFTARKLLDEPPSDLMKAVAEFPKDAAAVFSRHRAATVEINLASLESIIRIGLHACISIRQQGYDENTEVFSTREATLISEREERMAAECAWLAGNDGEPAWPAAPARRVKRPQRVLRLPGGQARTTVVRTDHKWPDRYFDNQTAAVWSDFVARDPRLVETAGRNLFLANADWLLATNKPAETDEDDGDIERVWTRALFECAAAGAKLWTPDDRHRLVFDLLNQFADEAFIDAAAAFLVKSDLLNIERGHADRVYLLSLRESIWSRLQKTSQWQRHLWSTRGGMEIHLKELIAAFFFKISYGFGQETSYTKGLEGAPMIPFLPLLTDIASAAPGCPMIAHLFLHVGELVGGDAAESYLLRAAEQWVVKCDERFWGEYGVGRKLCLLAMESDLGATPEAWLEIGDRAASAGVAEGENLKHRLLALLTNRVTGN